MLHTVSCDCLWNVNKPEPRVSLSLSALRPGPEQEQSQTQVICFMSAAVLSLVCELLTCRIYILHFTKLRRLISKIPKRKPNTILLCASNVQETPDVLSDTERLNNYSSCSDSVLCCYVVQCSVEDPLGRLM